MKFNDFARTPVTLAFLSLALLLVPGPAPAQEGTTYIPVGSARTKKTVIAFTDIRNTGGQAAAIAKTISETVNRDLSFMDIFRFLPATAFIENPATSGILPGTFKFSDWSSIGAEFLVKAAIGVEGKNMTLEANLYDTFGAKQVLAKRYVAFTADAKTVAHTLANNIVEALTGLPGIFMTRVAMSCDRTGKKEIYIMDFDGSNVKQVTKHRSISFAPAWSPDGTRIAYSLYNRHKRNIKNIDLYEYNFVTETVRMLSNRKGINSGAAYSPDGKKIALTMSFLGNPEIFLLDAANSTVTPVTKSFGFDVDPTWSPDGKHVAFVSSRTGMPMVYSSNLDGSKVQRLTFAGRYNATPSWSPQNNKIAFSGWLDGRFDIFIMNPDGSNIERLTKSQGNNEDPNFSPDGNFIVFSSNRTGQQNIYAMNVDGTFVKRLTYGLGNCVAPRWSGPTKMP
ncbi:MAG TPA: Tol-Pal system beta propeller repeat protein TolB [Bdellovibrionales bacterium]|nr:MAG: Tol-Pal system beta propeller repeat protein TolB [Bdellovibrionales bacterium GWA1_52_35]OFZ43271.1 MAG: Tol-Pal system beta propeller repeat protein TolB [Bdellovibrionales bacterium GWC1_52_8]HAR42013.1 Tol-Pal system beta propeller repeat protein TolB [Bdellovibrionales bacterium]HCM41277.1 Tol-Pal system beta propeller repeat protein TolB [Bdellovibrionales bacterium]